MHVSALRAYSAAYGYFGFMQRTALAFVSMKIDLHCHTNRSDGTLSPEQLFQLAIERDLDVLAITDHDSIAAYKDYPPGVYESDGAQNDEGLMLISGCEFSALWSGSVIHIVGLDFDLDAQEVIDLNAETAELREQRGHSISDALAKLGIEGCYEGAKRLAGDGLVGRPHFARYLVELGVVPNEKKAFKKYLGKGKPGDTKIEWPSVEKVVKVIQSAGGVSVVAHPIHYDFTRTKLLRFFDEFKQAGGRAIEVISGKQPPNQVQQLIEIANERDLLCSQGSDFHKPDQPWAELGNIATLPKMATPVWRECKSLAHIDWLK